MEQQSADSVVNIEIIKLKFRPIIDQNGTYTYKAATVIPQYLKLLCNSENTIKDTESFAKFINESPPVREGKEDICYDIERYFTNMLIKKTIDYTLDQIYVQHKLKPTCSKLIFKHLLVKFVNRSYFYI